MNRRPSRPERRTRRRIEASFFYDRVIPVVLIGLAVALVVVVLLALWAVLS